MKPYYLISDDRTFAFSAENPTGTRGGGSRGGDCTKLRPTVTINPGETVTRSRHDPEHLVHRLCGPQLHSADVLGGLRLSQRGSPHFRLFRLRL